MKLPISGHSSSDEDEPAVVIDEGEGRVDQAGEPVQAEGLILSEIHLKSRSQDNPAYPLRTVVPDDKVDWNVVK